MLKDFKPVLIILMRFIVLYIVLVIFYQYYLNSYASGGLDPISHWIADQCAGMQNALGYTTKIVDRPEKFTSFFLTNGQYTTRMVEGCNAISIGILFLSFVFAFYKGAKTFAFAAIGLVVLHIFNISRIIGLNILCIEYPQYINIGHDYAFPAFIYGGVVLLWIVWVKFYVLKK